MSKDNENLVLGLKSGPQIKCGRCCILLGLRAGEDVVDDDYVFRLVLTGIQDGKLAFHEYGTIMSHDEYTVVRRVCLRALHGHVGQKEVDIGEPSRSGIYNVASGNVAFGEDGFNTAIGYRAWYATDPNPTIGPTGKAFPNPNEAQSKGPK